MYKIYTVNAHDTIDFAAQELKKHIRMMMPRCGDVPISLCPEATDGFRLGLMSDFGMDAEVADPRLDDVIYVKTDATSGIIAGSNPRSVHLALYRNLKKQGCVFTALS